MTRLRRLCRALAAWPWMAAIYPMLAVPAGSTRHRVDETTTTGFNLGGTLRLREGLALLLSAGRGLRGAVQGNRGAACLGLRASFP